MSRSSILKSNVRSRILSVSSLASLENSAIIDIRSRSAYLADHIANSVNLTTKDEILDFIERNPKAQYILCCFSSTRAQNLAKQIDNPLVKFYDGNLIEAKESGVQFTSSDDRFIALLNDTRAQILARYKKYKRAWIVTFSGGKDSTCVLQLMYEMITKLPKDELNPTYAILSDTLVEAPNVAVYFKNIVKAINLDAKMRGLPFEIIVAHPSPQNEFWVNLIGKGYPSPTRIFRWCTERLKINPMKSIVKSIVEKHGSAIMTLGVRKSESMNRRRSIEKRTVSEDGFSKHDDYENVLIYSPITEWLTEDVWSYLTTQNPPPWGISHAKLFSLYSQASGDECQFIIDKSQSSCGGSRFGCWVCTLVNEDKSMQGFIKSGESSLVVLNEFRNFIKEARENRSMRCDFKKDGSFRPGPFTSSARKEILRRLLRAEAEFKACGGSELISDEQLGMIAKIWEKEFDSESSCITISKEFGRMQNIEISTPILEDIDLIDTTSKGGEAAKRIISEIVRKEGIKDNEIYEIIMKNIDDETAKLGESDDIL
ncbi:DNA phosphorothioation system sulfurtransferase DndC [uncultured Campylobacter sp.]|uniref:DNA phosphorothioation system sulfurtransferase DndC n=1 Tax=uncultured Campylobacter sp. TaxID=218934 RepID=UPI002612BE47|nr:DNA phosphorothioation system sulfurtransferase DndC [uncultured Campylobacter sp.]